jgi:hypothetical protein
MDSSRKAQSEDWRGFAAFIEVPHTGLPRVKEPASHAFSMAA